MDELLNECGDFECGLQSAMDRRLSPMELLGSHPHPADCAACRQLLADFELLHASLRHLPVAAGSFHAESTEENRRRPTPPRAARPAEPAGAARRGQRRLPWPELSRNTLPVLPGPVVAIACILLVGLVLVSRIDPRGVSSDGGHAVVFRYPERSLVETPNRDLAVDRWNSGAPEAVQTPNLQPAIDNGFGPPTTLASCSWLADQIPGVPPVRTSVEKTINWFRRSVPVPPVLRLPEYLPGFGIYHRHELPQPV